MSTFLLSSTSISQSCFCSFCCSLYQRLQNRKRYMNLTMPYTDPVTMDIQLRKLQRDTYFRLPNHLWNHSTRAITQQAVIITTTNYKQTLISIGNDISAKLSTCICIMLPKPAHMESPWQHVTSWCVGIWALAALAGCDIPKVLCRPIHSRHLEWRNI